MDKVSSQPYYHGTKADLKLGDLIEPGNGSNYGKEKQAACIYLTATFNAATWGAELALGEGPNPIKSYRSRNPLRVTGEVADLQGHSPEARPFTMQRGR